MMQLSSYTPHSVVHLSYYKNYHTVAINCDTRCIFSPPLSTQLPHAAKWLRLHSLICPMFPCE